MRSLCSKVAESDARLPLNDASRLPGATGYYALELSLHETTIDAFYKLGIAKSNAIRIWNPNSEDRRSQCEDR
jgi:hypothetical protein